LGLLRFNHYYPIDKENAELEIGIYAVDADAVILRIFDWPSLTRDFHFNLLATTLRIFDGFFLFFVQNNPQSLLIEHATQYQESQGCPCALQTRQAISC
jgi:hypothetical protein